MLVDPIVNNHCTIYVNQTIMLHTLNLHGDLCQSFLNKTGKKFTICIKYLHLKEVIQLNIILWKNAFSVNPFINRPKTKN